MITNKYKIGYQQIMNTFLRTGGGPPGVLFYHGFYIFSSLLTFLFIKYIFEPQQLFFQIRIKNSLDELPLVFQNCC